MRIFGIAGPIEVMWLSNKVSWDHMMLFGVIWAYWRSFEVMHLNVKILKNHIQII